MEKKEWEKEQDSAVVTDELQENVNEMSMDEKKTAGENEGSEESVALEEPVVLGENAEIEEFFDNEEELVEEIELGNQDGAKEELSSTEKEEELKERLAQHNWGAQGVNAKPVLSMVSAEEVHKTNRKTLLQVCALAAIPVAAIVICTVSLGKDLKNNLPEFDLNGAKKIVENTMEKIEVEIGEDTGEKEKPEKKEIKGCFDVFSEINGKTTIEDLEDLLGTNYTEDSTMGALEFDGIKCRDTVGTMCFYMDPDTEMLTYGVWIGSGSEVKPCKKRVKKYLTKLYGEAICYDDEFWWYDEDGNGFVVKEDDSSDYLFVYYTPA